MKRPHTHQIVFLLVLLPLLSGCAFFADTVNRTAPARGTSTPSSIDASSCTQHAPITGTITRVISNFRNLPGPGAILVDGVKYG